MPVAAQPGEHLPSAGQCHSDEECSQVVDLLQQAWRGINAGGQCRVERCFRVTWPDTSEQYVALKTAVQSLTPLVIATIIR